MRRINRCLNGKLLEICQQVVQLEELDTKLYAYLPQFLHEHCRVGSFNKGCLVLIANDPVWASQLRYSLPELRDKLRSEAGIYHLISIKVNIAIEKPVEPVKKRSTLSISAKACNTITAQAKECNYTPLQQALYHLADQSTESI